MEVYYIWLIAAIVLVIVEIATAGFGALCFALGAGCSAIAAYCGLSFAWQLLIFCVVSIVCFLTLRPFVKRFIESRNKDFKTNADSLAGRTGVVSETIDNTKHTGRVKVDGDDWKAVSAGGETIECGTEVRIIKVESIIVTVEKI